MSSSEYSSLSYQKYMWEFLGDRDYDNFENDQLDELKNKIGFSFYGAPQTVEGYDNNQKESIDKIYDVIMKENDGFSKYKDRVVISFITVCTEPLESEKIERQSTIPDYNPDADFQPLPVFILRKCKQSSRACRVIIDHSGRVYKSWENYLKENHLPKCLMVFPKNGKYTESDEEVLLEKRFSPSCSADAELLRVADVASTGIGIASAGVAIAASIPAVTILGPAALVGASVAGVGVGIYSIGRSIGDLVDRVQHREDISLSNREARSAYLNIGAGIVGFAGSGATYAVSSLASRGVNIGRGTSLLVNTLQVASIGTSGLSIVNSTNDVVQNAIEEQRAPSLLTIVQLSSSILFFTHAVYNFQTTQSIIEETQGNMIKELRKSFKGKKMRRTFQRLRKTAFRRNDGNFNKANAQIISKMKNIIDSKQLINLSNYDRNLERLGIKYIMDTSGFMTFKGIPVELGGSNGLPSEDFVNYLSLPTSEVNLNIPELLGKMLMIFSNIDLGSTQNFLKLSEYYCELTNRIPNLCFSILDIISKVLQNSAISDLIMKSFEFLFPQAYDKCLNIINVIISFLYCEAKKIQEIFFSTLSPSEERRELFEHVINNNLDEYDTIKWFMKFICNNYCSPIEFTRECIEPLKKYTVTFLTEKVYEYKEKQIRNENRRNDTRRVRKIKCTECNGECYTVIS